MNVKTRLPIILDGNPQNITPLWAPASVWLGDCNIPALWLFCCVFLFENLSQAA